MTGYGMMGSGNNRYADAWRFDFFTGSIDSYTVGNSHRLFPVINLKSDVTVTGTGISTDPYVVE